MLHNVQAEFLALEGDAEQPCEPQAAKEHERRAANPCNLCKERRHGDPDQAAAAVEGADAAALLAAVVESAVVGVGWGGEEGGGEAAPEAARAMDGEGVEGVVHLEDVEHKAGRAEADDTADGTDEHGRPWVDGGAGRTDRDEAAEDAVAQTAPTSQVLEPNSLSSTTTRRGRRWRRTAWC